MYQLKLGKSISVFREEFEGQVLEAVSLGFYSMDFDLCAFWNKRDEEIKVMTAEKIREKLEFVKRSGLKINGVHISFGPFWDLSSPDEEKRASAVKNIKEILPVIDPYEPICYILHGSYEPIANEVRIAHIDALKRSLKELVAATRSVFAVEILPRTCLMNTSKEAVEIVDELALEQVKVCVDVNHYLQEKSEDGVLALGDRIVTTHISDHDYVDERHLLPGQGNIDWMKLLAAFEKVGYQGVFNYESAGTLKEVKENYDNLFAQYNAK